jgi:hypothetical protein
MRDLVYKRRVIEHSIYGEAKHGIEGLRDFLTKAKAVHCLLPNCWNDKKQAECEALGYQSGWSSLSVKISETEIGNGYGDPKLMDKQLRLLAEDIYGTVIEDSSPWSSILIWRNENKHEQDQGKN